MTTGQRIKMIRNKLGFTQDKLASDANMSRSYLADVENDRYNPSFDTLERIAEALNVSTDRLTGESASSIIENRLNEKGVTLEEIAKKQESLYIGFRILIHLHLENGAARMILRISG